MPVRPRIRVSMLLSGIVLSLTWGLGVPTPGAVGQEPKPEVPSFARELPAIRSGEPIFRFNGKDLTGFYPYVRDRGRVDPKHVFSVRDGVIDISGEEFGGLTTEDEFQNYHLIAEWKWGDRTWAPRKHNARDSGILVHCVGPDGAAGGNWMESQECQVIEGGCGDFIMVAGRSKPILTCEARRGPDRQYYFEKGAKPVTLSSVRYNWWGRDPAWKDVLGFRGRRDVEKPAGEWNRMEVVCDGDSITTILNGSVVNIGTHSSLTKGKILFQSEGAEILFRKVEVRPLVK
ncbi:MAG: DUF1080 domain-containing protein [Isosphaeraceae bacterium]